MSSKHFSPLGFPTEDWLTQTSAATLVRRITSYWEQRGRFVAVWTEPISVGSGVCYVVRSDLVNGMPRGQG